MEPDGRSFLTSVGTRDSAIWIHDEKGDHQMSSEGETFSALFSRDGTKLFYLKSAGQSNVAELWSTGLATGRSERIVPGYSIDGGYDLTNDGNRVAFANKDEKGISHLWIASTDHRTSPVQLTSMENEDLPWFLPNGDLIYRASEGGKNYIYTRKQDGSGRNKLLEEPILELGAVSPDGRWLMVWQKEDKDKDHPYRVRAYPNGGGTPVVVCRSMCQVAWSVDGKYLYLSLQFGPMDTFQTHLFPVRSEVGLPKLPPEGLGKPEDLKESSKSTVLPQLVDSMLGPEKYSYTRSNVRRNIYRIPIL
jgi:Tol biopolymer transport system component